MKVLSITPNCYCVEKSVEPLKSTIKKSCKAKDFEWHCYLKEEHHHNIALSLFTK